MANVIPNKPPLNAKVEDFPFKEWFQSVWRLAIRTFSPYKSDSGATTVTSDLSATENYFFPIDATLAQVTISLPPANKWLGKPYFFKKIDATGNLCIVAVNGTDNIEGAGSISLVNQWDSVELYSNGIDTWYNLFGSGSGGTSGGGTTPYFIASGQTFIVPLYYQNLFEMTIDNEGILQVDGFLIEVD